MNFGNLLSSAGTQALAAYQSSEHYSNLSGISTKNTYTNANCGFNSGSIFNNSSGIQGAYNSGYYGKYSGDTTNYWQLGDDGLNRNGAISRYLTTRSAIPSSEKDYVKGDYGASLIGNYCTSIQSVALGQYAPTSVFEQRLNYHLDYADQNKPGAFLGSSSNYFNTDSVANNKSPNSNYNVFATAASNTSTSSPKLGNGFSKVSSAQNVSDLMSLSLFA